MERGVESRGGGRESLIPERKQGAREEWGPRKCDPLYTDSVLEPGESQWMVIWPCFGGTSHSDGKEVPTFVGKVR